MTQHTMLETRKLNRRQLRKSQTIAEKRLWNVLRDKHLGICFRRQFSFGRYVVDFYAYQQRLVIEIDGDYHQSLQQKEYDTIRTHFLEKIGCQVIRFTNNQVIHDLDGVLNTIKKAIVVR